MSSYTGSLMQKRKPELVEIAQALELDAEAKVSDLIKNIQAHLDSNETSLSNTPMFKGLYHKSHRRSTGNNSSEDGGVIPVVEIKTAVGRGRKSINKMLDKVVDAANIPLPDSPVAKIQESAEQAVERANEAISTVSTALTPSSHFRKDLTVQLSHATVAVRSFVIDHSRRTEESVRVIRNFLSAPDHLLSTAVSIELVFLLAHVVQWYDHTLFFPPVGGEKGSITSLLHSLLFWLPSVQWTVPWPEITLDKWRSHVVPAVLWWLSTTVLPPLALSTVVSFVPQHGQSGTGHKTRYSATHPPVPTIDALTFALFRLAALIFPLTSAAPSAMIDALELSGDLQGRVLGAGLVVGLVIAQRLGA
ncbi:hypothetical protein BCR39DRAFT_540018 [Naematelia encephala]|uniref:Uncharacterized protein n=1 Tax=Naematelia encephala TaxID=71784 RepID=A0A1Y2AWF9_9TREE|nr:hypothetical protein BCR39DRAFT_540018 [Naematelia encephala]